MRFGNSEKNFKCNFPNIELKVNAYAYKGNNEYILQFDETQSGSDIYFVLQTNNSFNVCYILLQPSLTIHLYTGTVLDRKIKKIGKQ